MSQWTVSCRAGTSRSTIERVELGQRRPTASLLASFAIAVQRQIPPVPYDQAAALEVFHRLVDAAGSSLVVDTPGGVNRRERRLRAAERLWARHVRERFAAEQARECERRAEFRASLRMLKRASVGDSLAILDRLLQR